MVNPKSTEVNTKDTQVNKLYGSRCLRILTQYPTIGVFWIGQSLAPASLHRAAAQHLDLVDRSHWLKIKSLQALSRWQDPRVTL